MGVLGRGTGNKDGNGRNRRKGEMVGRVLQCSGFLLGCFVVQVEVCS